MCSLNPTSFCSQGRHPAPGGLNPDPKPPGLFSGSPCTPSIIYNYGQSDPLPLVPFHLHLLAQVLDVQSPAFDFPESTSSLFVPRLPCPLFSHWLSLWTQESCISALRSSPDLGVGFQVILTLVMCNCSVIDLCKKEPLLKKTLGLALFTSLLIFLQTKKEEPHAAVFSN